MKVPARVFLIIGLVSSIIIIIYGFVFVSMTSSYGDSGFGGFSAFFLIYGFYALITSIGGLASLSGSSKTAVNVWAVLYIPVVLLASIFMFCVKEEDMY